VLKQSVQWRPQQLPELIEKLRLIVSAQYVETDRALCSLGDLTLAATHSRHRLTPEVWQRMSAQQKTKAVDNCFRLHQVPTSTSTDGGVTVATTPGGGCKMHQHKLARADHTTTVSKRLHGVVSESDGE